MGIAVFEIELMKRVQPLGAVLTLGRQTINMPGNRGGFADDLLRSLGATSVDALDYSDFEGASFTGDLNGPIDLGQQFDTVIDFGTSEHIFNVAEALRNCIRLCKVGGNILHSLPANSDCGHGFYQLSPALFFALYSANNGFSDTEVFIADLMDERHWWQAREPRPGERLMANSLTTSYVLARTVKRADRPLNVNQADYEDAWESGPRSVAGKHDGLREVIKRTPLRHAAIIAYRSLRAPTGLTRFNPNLRKVPLSAPTSRAD
jgi:SAM-dependent methyltransferase